MEEKDLRKIIREGFAESISEDSNDNYMANQNIDSIVKSANIVSSHIKDGDKQEDWVEDKLSKVAENLRALRDYFEKDSDQEEELDEMHGMGHTLKHGNKLGELPRDVQYRDNDRQPEV